MSELRPDCPALAAGTRCVRQTEDGKVQWVVRAGGSGKYLRVGQREAVMLELVDGQRSPAEIAVAYTARAREPVTAADVEGFVQRMRQLAVIQETAEMRNLLLVEKARQKRQERLFTGKFGALLFWRFPLLNPDRFLTALEKRVRWVFTGWFLVFAAVVVVAAAAVLTARSDEVFTHLQNFTRITSGAGLSLAAAWITTFTVVALHELSHGVACKHWGGEVHEMGFLLLFFQPCFYCNVNDAWTFESRAQRLWVTAAGGFTELVLGSVCVLLWAVTDPGSAIHGVCYLVFMISLSSTLLFNLNPLIKLDGYYLLADFVRVDNLRERSMRQLSWLFRGKLLRMPAAPVARDTREAVILTAYGISSSLYMAGLLLLIVHVLFGELAGEGGPGFLLTCFFIMIFWMITKPVFRAVGDAMKHGAAAQVARHGTRGFALRGAAGAAVLAAAAFLVPWTRTADATAHAEPGAAADVRSPLRGRIAEVLVAEGDEVSVGTPLLRVEAPLETARASMERATADRLHREALRLHGAGDASRAAAMEDQAEAARLRAEDMEKRLSESSVPSPMAGTILTRRAAELEGSPVGRNTPVLRVGDLSRVRFRPLLDARASGAVKAGMEAMIRFRENPGDPLRGRVVAVSNTPVDATRDPRARDLTGPHWEVVVEAENPGGRVRPGMAGEVEVELGRTSLAGAVLRGVSDAFRPDVMR